MAPSAEEEERLQEHKDDSPCKLAPAEAFLKALLDVPFSFKRVDAMLYIANFDSEVNFLIKSFETLEVHHLFFLSHFCSASKEANPKILFFVCCIDSSNVLHVVS